MDLLVFLEVPLTNKGLMPSRRLLKYKCLEIVMDNFIAL